MKTFSMTANVIQLNDDLGLSVERTKLVGTYFLESAVTHIVLKVIRS